MGSGLELEQTDVLSQDWAVIIRTHAGQGQPGATSSYY